MGGMILPVISGVLGAFGQIQAGRAQAAQADAESKAAAMNAQIAAINADMAKSDSKIQQARAAEEAHKAQGRQRAALAQGGMLYSATGDSLLEESQRNAEEQQAEIGRQGEIEALNYKIQRGNYLNRSSAMKAGAKASRTGSYLGAAGSLLGGVSQAYEYNRLYGSKKKAE